MKAVAVSNCLEVYATISPVSNIVWSVHAVIDFLIWSLCMEFVSHRLFLMPLDIFLEMKVRSDGSLGRCIIKFT